MIRMTEEEYEQFVNKANAAHLAKVSRIGKKQKQRKYKNRYVYVYEDGFVAQMKIEGHGAVLERYDSEKEFRRYRELQLWEKAGLISGLRRQVPLQIQAAFTDNEGVKHQEIAYKADAIYIKDGVEIVEDVKAFDQKTGKYRCTEAFTLKWKLLQAKYPEKQFKLF